DGCADSHERRRELHQGQRRRRSPSNRTVNDVARRSALAALDRARPAIARLDQSRHFEELAADLMESWSAVETALRSLVGGTTLGGQALIREARQRQMLSFEQANALAEFHAASARAHGTD